MDNITVYSVNNLPNGMIGLHTPLGEQLWNRTHLKNTLMVERYHKQTRPTYCGPASLALLINALNLAYRVKYLQVQKKHGDEMKFFCEADRGRKFMLTENDIVNQTDVEAYLNTETDINHEGLAIQQLGNVASILGLGVNLYYACGAGVCNSTEMKEKLCDATSSSDYVLKNVDQFRRVASGLIQRPVTGVIVNYHLAMLGYLDLHGHFSPLAAYDVVSDRFLVMDVWMYTPPAWVKTDKLFRAMSSIDDGTSLPRGMLHIHELLV